MTRFSTVLACVMVFLAGCVNQAPVSDSSKRVARPTLGNDIFG
jgi:PBP1b-binding outer membrane lipoprotein LpoB